MNDQVKLQRATYHLWTFTVSKFLTNFGAQVYAFAVSFYILQLTGSAATFALNLLFSILPRTLAAPFAGYVADRYSRKKVVIISHLATVLAIVALITISFTATLTLPILYTATAIFSLTSTFSSLAFTSSITGLVDQDRIQKAMSLNQMVMSAAAIASPVIGGLLYGFVSIPLLVSVYLVAVLIALGLESTMNFNLFKETVEHEEVEKTSSMWRNMKEGFSYVRRQPVILTMLSIALVINFLMGAYQVGSSYLLIDKLQMPSKHFGLIEGAFAVGMLLMSIYMSVRPEVRYPLVTSKRGILFLGMVIGVYSLPVMIPIPYSLMFSYYILLMFLIGVAIIFINTPIHVMMQKQIDDSYKGRVFAIIETGASALTPLGTILFGFLYDLFPAPFVMISSAILLIISILYLARPAILRKAHPELTSVQGRHRDRHHVSPSNSN